MTRSVAILHPRSRADTFVSRFGALCAALAGAGVRAESVAYADEIVDAVEAQLARAQLVLVWHNPIEDGRTRKVLDAMLRRVAALGVSVSAHPDTIVRMGTKDVLVAVRDLPFGSDSHRIDSLSQLTAALPQRLASGPRVLKQPRGHSGIGVWRVEQLDADRFALQHAARGSLREEVSLERVLERLTPYFSDGGHMIDQAWQPGLRTGMVRAYLVRDRVAGFGHQAINALYPTIGEPSQRLYSDADDPRFQALRRLLEEGWIQLLCKRLGVTHERLPCLWDADFIPGDAAQHYVLCEINVSSVSPYPESANAALLQAVLNA